MSWTRFAALSDQATVRRPSAPPTAVRSFSRDPIGAIGSDLAFLQPCGRIVHSDRYLIWQTSLTLCVAPVMVTVRDVHRTGEPEPPSIAET